MSTRAAGMQAEFGLSAFLTMLFFPLGFNSVLGVFCALLSFQATFGNFLPNLHLPGLHEQL